MSSAERPLSCQNESVPKWRFAAAQVPSFELPVCYATGSAEYFALGAVSLLDRLGVVDSICFGSECADLEAMEQAADVLLTEPEGYQTLLRRYLKEGNSFPSAREEALAEYTGSGKTARILKDPQQPSWVLNT